MGISRHGQYPDTSIFTDYTVSPKSSTFDVLLGLSMDYLCLNSGWLASVQFNSVQEHFELKMSGNCSCLLIPTTTLVDTIGKSVYCLPSRSLGLFSFFRNLPAMCSVYSRVFPGDR